MSARLHQRLVVPHDATVEERLSFGQQRVVALSAILLSRKPLLVLDEPLAGLAGLTREAVLTELRTVASRKLVLVAEHDIHSIMSVADRILALKRGQIAIDRSAAQIDESTVLALFD
jgi:ABC-type branched-subunit amino acid transport system ATPase component